LRALSGGFAAERLDAIESTRYIEEDATGLGNSDWFFRKNSGSNKDTILDSLNGDIVDSL